MGVTGTPPQLRAVGAKEPLIHSDVSEDQLRGYTRLTVQVEEQGTVQVEEQGSQDRVVRNSCPLPNGEEHGGTSGAYCRRGTGCPGGQAADLL